MNIKFERFCFVLKFLKQDKSTWRFFFISLNIKKCLNQEKITWEAHFNLFYFISVSKNS